MLVFLDCGFHKGECFVRLPAINLEKLKEHDYHYSYYGFEANPNLKGPLDKVFQLNDTARNLQIIKKAVSDHNGKESFYITPENTMGSSFYKSNHYQCQERELIEVECIDLAEWIKENLNKDDYVIMKMGIEGEEYKLIPHLIKTGAIKYIDKMYCEFRNINPFERKGAQSSVDLIKLLSNNIDIHAWKAWSFADMNLFMEGV